MTTFYEQEVQGNPTDCSYKIKASLLLSGAFKRNKTVGLLSCDAFNEQKKKKILSASLSVQIQRYQQVSEPDQNQIKTTDQPEDVAVATGRVQVNQATPLKPVSDPQRERKRTTKCGGMLSRGRHGNGRSPCLQNKQQNLQPCVCVSDYS